MRGRIAEERLFGTLKMVIATSMVMMMMISMGGMIAEEQLFVTLRIDLWRRW